MRKLAGLIVLFCTTVPTFASGGSEQGNAKVPEPTTIALLGIGIVAMRINRSKK